MVWETECFVLPTDPQPCRPHSETLPGWARSKLISRPLTVTAVTWAIEAVTSLVQLCVILVCGPASKMKLTSVSG